MPIRPKKPSQPDQTLPAKPAAPANTAPPAEIDPRVLADIAVNPITTAATLTQRYNKGSVGDVDVVEMAAAIKAVAADSAKGDHTAQRAMLIGQSITPSAPQLPRSLRGIGTALAAGAQGTGSEPRHRGGPGPHVQRARTGRAARPCR